ncbi:MAG: hypothetical protein Q9211_002239 [Gyalolechia sp. 1 TL-2023]
MAPAPSTSALSLQASDHGQSGSATRPQKSKEVLDVEDIEVLWRLKKFMYG